MSQCMKISLTIRGDKEKIQELLKEYAHEFQLEGVLQSNDEHTVKVVACSTTDEIEGFLAQLHKEFAKDNLEILEIEPFLKDRDYRGVFRVIE